MTTSLSRTVAEFAVNLRYEDIPPEAVREAKRFMLDSVGCAFGGYEAEDPRILLGVHRDLGGTPQATILGSGEKTNVVNAAFLNALMVRALDYNDIYWEEDPSHPTDIMPAAWALAEWKGLSGRDVIVGIVLGHEIEMRLCDVGRPGIRERGWHHATLTGFAAPVVAAKMLGLDVEQSINATGIAASHTFTLGSVTAGHLTMMKNTVDPMATRAGVEAALMAERGFTGPEPIYEGKEGLVHCLGDGWDWEALTKTLGERFRITDCAYKLFPTEALTHQPLSAALMIREKHGVTPEQITDIEIRTTARGADILCDKDKYRPTTRETADHSLPYCMARALVDGALTPQSFSEEAIRDERVLGLAAKIRGVADPEIDAAFPAKKTAIVSITTADGQSHTETVDHAKGSPQNPAGEEEIRAKFDALCHMLSAERRGEIAEAIGDLEDWERFADVMSLLIVGR
jgi:2-methylcitrate dehydratase